tara:strand:- start:818 stop:1003 length:186 start_codon:yes stop_codon:yes gene_type:complete
MSEVILRVTNEMVREWLGTSNQLNEAIDVIQAIANGQYTVDALNQDIVEYFSEDIIRLRSK